MKKISKKVFIVLPMLAFLISYSLIPESITIGSGKTADFGLGMSVKTDELCEGKYNYPVKLFNLIPIKTVSVLAKSDEYLIPSGEAIGVKMYTQGVLVVGLGDIFCDGKKYQPAKNAGVLVGDVITGVNDEVIASTIDFSEKVNDAKGEVKLAVRRGEKEYEIPVSAVYMTETDSYKVGLWVRDSLAGIGTLTFYNPKDNTFAALGHGICDTDTKEIMGLSRGSINFCDIKGVKKGESGTPGELLGSFCDSKAGTLTKNSQLGIFGKTANIPQKEAMPIGLRYEIKCGKAEILCDVSGEGVKPYEIEITRISKSQKVSNKSFTIRITDKELLEKTGGIVQGMSGSPIIQNGKLIGAVTHVFVNDPTRGYGIFIENMLDEAIKVN